MLADLESLIPPAIMAVIFVAVVRVILKAQNPRRRAAVKAREEDAEALDPRITGADPLVAQAEAERRVKADREA
jgi:hypothetical protein